MFAENITNNQIHLKNFTTQKGSTKAAKIQCNKTYGEKSVEKKLFSHSYYKCATTQYNYQHSVIVCLTKGHKGAIETRNKSE